MRKYYYRQLSTRWFDRYLLGCGIILNALALISVASAFLPRPSRDEFHQSQRARLELEDGARCGQLMSGREFIPMQASELKMLNGSSFNLSYRDRGVHTRGPEGQEIHMVDADRVGFLFFEVGPDKKIRRCLPPAQVDCISAMGEILANGDCAVPVNLPSDCGAMSGVMDGARCRVRAGFKILKTSVVAKNGKSCVAANCERN